jgi:hypothetical protein
MGVLLRSLSLSEDEREPFNAKLKQDHVGCVALLKLAHASPGALAAAPHAPAELVRCCHAACAVLPRGMSRSSHGLLLEATARVVASGGAQGRQVRGALEGALVRGV